MNSYTKRASLELKLSTLSDKAFNLELPNNISDQERFNLYPVR